MLCCAMSCWLLDKVCARCSKGHFPFIYLHCLKCENVKQFERYDENSTQHQKRLSDRLQPVRGSVGATRQITSISVSAWYRLIWKNNCETFSASPTSRDVIARRKRRAHSFAETRTHICVIRFTIPFPFSLLWTVRRCLQNGQFMRKNKSIDMTPFNRHNVAYGSVHYIICQPLSPNNNDVIGMAVSILIITWGQSILSSNPMS